MEPSLIAGGEMGQAENPTVAGQIIAVLGDNLGLRGKFCPSYDCLVGWGTFTLR